MCKEYKKGISVIIAAAGNSIRMNGENKLLIELGGYPVIVRTISKFSELSIIDEIIIVTKQSDIKLITELTKKYNLKKVSKVLNGGSTRQESVYIGLKSAKYDKVMIHDGARPMISKDRISALATELEKHCAVTLGVHPKDTIKSVTEDGFVLQTLDRDKLMQIQTPQGFDTKLILEAHQKNAKCLKNVTDDCALVELLGIRVHIIRGDYSNIKITTPEDAVICKHYF